MMHFSLGNRWSDTRLDNLSIFVTYPVLHRWRVSNASIKLLPSCRKETEVLSNKHVILNGESDIQLKQINSLDGLEQELNERIAPSFKVAILTH